MEVVARDEETVFNSLSTLISETERLLANHCVTPLAAPPAVRLPPLPTRRGRQRIA